ncbi:NACHT, LRR and PYD domains-containing protein 3-like isoform X2 [Sardina pilchardus]|uniref:NACHT, LRR and PYD domains-containing protein 3-like isoform X2 n=1 Tax=Sardina pilchardus TaxID=27697 RepID=UPI002E164E6C
MSQGAETPHTALHCCVVMETDGDMDNSTSTNKTSTQTNAGPHTHRPPSPVPSCVSMKSDQSINEPLQFSSGPVLPGLKPNTHRPPSPVPSCVSMKSDQSINEPLQFSSVPVLPGLKPQTHRPPSSVPSCVSLKSDQSINEPLQFSSGPVLPGLKPQTHRPPSPVPSCVSMRSDMSINEPLQFSSGPVLPGLKPQTHRPPSSVPSCVSLKSDQSINEPLQFSSGPVLPGLKPQTHRPPSPVPSCVSMRSDMSINEPLQFSSGPVLPGLNELSADQTGRQREDEDLEGVKDNHNTPTHATVRTSQPDENLMRVIEKHKASLKTRVENISEGIIKPGAEILLNEIYTELYITEGESEGVNKEHEVWQVESASRRETTEDVPINCNDIFKTFPGQKRHIRSVMTKGVAGIGKTVSVQKFILDWTDGLANQDVDFMFPLSFRELNLVRDHEYCLHSLLLDFFPELKELNDCEGYKDCRVVFIFDGLDESRLTLDLKQNSELTDIKQTSSVDVLTTSLIQGTLLPSALIWITSRPAAASQIPAQYIDQVTEIRGFSDPQKEEYFRKRISDASQANRIFSHIKASRSLHIMCHIPVFCRIAATVLHQMLGQVKTQEIPQTLTEMFIQFLLIQATRKDEIYQSGTAENQERRLESQREILLKLAELAFKNLENGNLMFHEEDLRECGIDVTEASVYSGMCTEIFKEESVFHQKKVYCFVHLSVQEFLAALYVFHSYMTENFEGLKSIISDKHRHDSSPWIVSFLISIMSFVKSKLGLQSQDHVHVLLKSAVDEALKSSNGHLDLFLRFLTGIALESNQSLLQGLLNYTHSTSKSIKETCQYIKKLNREDLSPERCINLFHCLLEMKDHSMHEEIQKRLSSPKNNDQEWSPAHCSALAHMLLMSEEVLDEFDLKKYNTSNEGRRRLLPAVRCCRKARLTECTLSEKSYGIVVNVLQSPNVLIELDLSHNDLRDSGVQLLSKGLSSHNCNLQTLRLADCKLTDKSCEIVASVLQSPNSLLQLDLIDNDLGDSGVHLLSNGLSNISCKLHTLRLSDCLISEKGCGFLASALTSNPSHLKELDLSYNHPGESGRKLLSARLEDPHCKLEILKLSDCLSYNHPGESGRKLSSARLEDPVCKLEKLKIDHATVSRARPRLLRYACELTLDPNTAHIELCLSEGNRKVFRESEYQPYPDHPERFDVWVQVFCREGLSGRCYWEADWTGSRICVAVAYKSIERKGGGNDSTLGYNDKSWSLECYPDRCRVWHDDKGTVIPALSSRSRRVGVYLDWPAGTVSFYSVSSNTLTHLHTFHSAFTEPLYPGFWVDEDCSVSLCQIT